MCGIIGYAGADIDGIAERMPRARDEMIKRGPDDAGLWRSNRVCLGSRRLSVQDLSQAGHMPMTSADESLAIVFNGEIYNFKELRSELEREIPFRSTGDTEVILNGFRVWGWPALLEKLDGMFAFAIWDAPEQRLYGARDRLGEKPFFHTRIGAGFAFASTLRALLTLRGSAPSFDAFALDAYLTYQAVPAPFTMYQGIEQLPPAHAIMFNAQSNVVEISRYWDVRYAPKRARSEREAVDAIDDMTRRSVRLRLRSDVPTGTLLSGGVDSSLITALARQEVGAPIDAVTLGYDGPVEDERPFARIVAARCDVRLHEEVLAPHVVRDLPAIIWEYGQPLADVSIIPNYYLAAAARRFMTVALVGDGADEAFGGYARPMTERAAQVYRRSVPGMVRRGLAGVFNEKPGQRASNAVTRRLALLADAGRGSGRDAFVYDRGFRDLRSAAYATPLREAVRTWNPDSLYAAAWDRAVATDDVDRALYGDLTTYLPDQLLAKADVSSMAFGLETRSPFLSREIIEYAATIPTSLRLKGFHTKYLLKQVAERYVPAEVLHRRKRGFVIPAAHWLRTDLAPYVSAALLSPRFLDRGWIRADMITRLISEHADGSHDWSNQLWTLLVLAVWERLIDGALAPGDPLDALLASPARS